jgi:hypothetical protein
VKVSVLNKYIFLKELCQSLNIYFTQILIIMQRPENKNCILGGQIEVFIPPADKLHISTAG